MSSKRRLRRVARSVSCGEKRKYGSRIEAVRATYRKIKGVRCRMRAYLCEHCGSWHIGHARQHDKTVEILRQVYGT